MKSLAQDLRYAVRLLLKSPGFTLLAAITLALGIGANAAIFSVVNSVLLRPLPYQSPDRLMFVYSQFPSMNFDRFWVDPMEYWEYREKNRSFEKLGAYVTGAVNVSGGEEPVRADAALASAGLFEALGVDAQLGRYYGAAEDLPNGDPVTVISDGLWRRAFGADRGILGRRIKVDGADRTVIGVMPPGFGLGNERIDVWIPLALDPARPGFRGNHYLYLVGRLKPGVSIDQAKSELAGLVARWEDELPDDHTPHPEDHPMLIRPFLEDLVGDVRPKIQLLMGAVGLVLLIACANVANLLLARAEARQKEIAVRTALGADRGRLVRQFLTESVVLSLLGGFLGLILAYWGVRAIVAANLDSIPRVDEIGLDSRALLFTIGISLLTGLLFGLAPALHARTGAFFDSLKEGGQRTTANAGRLLLRRSLVVAEVALAAMLVIGGGLLIRSFWLLTQVDPGFDPKGLLSLQIALPDATYPDDNQVNAFYARLLDRLRQLPEVEEAAAMNGLPPNRQVNANDTEFEGVPEPPNGPIHNVDYWQFVTHGYFETMGIPVLQGRAFNASDAKGTPGVAVVNETLANLFWPGQSPLGKRVKTPGRRDFENPWLTVVGVVKDVKQGGLDKKTGTELYFLTDQSTDTVGGAADTMYLVLRTEGDPLRLVSSVREEIRRLDPALPLADVRPMTDVIFASVAQPRFVAFMVLVFAIVALALAAIGTYGVLAYTVEQRTQEIGVRMALGAQARQVLQMILAQGAWLVGLGLLLGVGGALALRRVLASVLFGVTPTDPAILGAVILVLSAVAFAACYLPARRATRVDPLVALRNE